MGEAFLIGNGKVFWLQGQRGETPPCPEAKFAKGDKVHVRKTKAVAHFPREAIVFGIVPSGFPTNWALADLLGEPRSLMEEHPVGKKVVRYIIGNEGDTTPYLAREGDLIATGEKVEIGSIRREQ